MKQLKTKVWARILAFLLLCLTVPVTAGCVFGEAYVIDEGWNSAKNVTFPETNLCQRIAYDDLYRLHGYLQERGLTPTILEDVYVQDGTSFIIRDSNGTALLITTTDRAIPCVENFDTGVVIPGTSSVAPTEPGSTYYIDTFLESDYLDADSSYYYANMVFELIHGMQNWFIPLGCIALALSVFLFIFLLMSAGHKEGEDGIVLLRQDRIPLDLYLALDILICCLGGVAASESLGYGPWYFDVMLVLLALPVVTGVVMALFMTLSARLKAGKWWQHTILYFVCSRLWKLLKQVFSLLPIFWKTALIYCGFMLMNLLLGSLAVFNYSEAVALLLVLLDLGVLGALLIGAKHAKELKKAGMALAAGDLSYTLDTSKMKWDMKEHGDDLNSISQGMNKAVGARMKSERMKAELITNVSHDIKTPLTSIINYIDLLKKEPIGSEKSAEYLDVLERQSQRLKKLTEDVVEASKATTGNLTVSTVRTTISELQDQFAGEYADRLTASGLELVVNHPKQELFIMADSRLLSRVFDNLFTNVCKYAQPGTRVYFTATDVTGNAEISMKNISREPLNVSAEELLERFVRGDSSRTGEGSGLGLSIAQSLTELQGGTFQLETDGDLFKACLSFPLVSAGTPEEEN